MSVFLQTTRLIFKTLSLTDMDNWCHLHTEPKEIILNWLNDHITHYQKYGFGMGSVYLKKTRQFIGRAGLYYYLSKDGIEHDIEMGCILHKNYWGQGYGSEISRALINFGFKQLGCNKLTALTEETNQLSRALLEKMGLQYSKNIHLDGRQFSLYEIYHP